MCLWHPSGWCQALTFGLAANAMVHPYTWRRAFITRHLIPTWHDLLKLKQHHQKWHRSDVIAELDEFRAVKSLPARSLSRFSELADVVFTSTRALHAGYHVPDVTGLFSDRVLLSLSLYMICKYSSRFILFRTAAAHVKYDQERRMVRAWMAVAHVREVRNPDKVEKVREIAMQYGLNPGSFEAKIRLWRRWWPLLP